MNEDDGDEMFGLVHGQEWELGYWYLSELAKQRGPMGLPIERDLYWKPRALAIIKEEAGVWTTH